MDETRDDRRRVRGRVLRSPKIVGRLVRGLAKSPGTAPGTLVHVGPQRVERVRVRVIAYDGDTLEEHTVEGVADALARVDDPRVVWINIDGLHDVSVLEAVGDRLGIHRLALEDVLSTATRPKVEVYDDHFLAIVKMLSFDADTESVVSEQVSFLVGDDWVVSFQERYGDIFEPVRVRLREGKGRLRTRGTDYLVYTLIDALVDHYFRILESVGDHVEDLEAAVFDDPTAAVTHRIHHLRREMLVVRRAVWPLREAIGELTRTDGSVVGEETRIFLRDVYDHTVQVIDTVETMRELLSSVLDLYMSGVSNRMNEVMKVLTIIATIFIPLSFLAGVYGMNFEVMPELAVPWAYPTLLGVMLAAALGMLAYFRRKGWL